jgi:hypothetical protein
MNNQYLILYLKRFLNFSNKNYSYWESSLHYQRLNKEKELRNNMWLMQGNNFHYIKDIYELLSLLCKFYNLESSNKTLHFIKLFRLIN